MSHKAAPNHALADFWFNYGEGSFNRAMRLFNASHTCCSCMNCRGREDDVPGGSNVDSESESSESSDEEYCRGNFFGDCTFVAPFEAMLTEKGFLFTTVEKSRDFTREMSSGVHFVAADSWNDVRLGQLLSTDDVHDPHMQRYAALIDSLLGEKVHYGYQSLMGARFARISTWTR